MSYLSQTFSHQSTLVLICLHDHESFLFGMSVKLSKDLKEKTGGEENVKFEVPTVILPSERKRTQECMKQAKKNEPAKEMARVEKAKEFGVNE